MARYSLAGSRPGRPRRAAAAFLALLLGLGGLLAACAPAEEESKELKIGLINYQANDTFINSLSSAVRASMRKREREGGKRILLNVFAAKSDQYYQNTLIDRMLKQNYDVLCINMVDRTMTGPIVDKCRAAEVPIVFYNREPVAEDLAKWDKLYYVGSSAIESARIQGEILLELLRQDFARVDRNGDGAIQYVMLEGEPGHQDALYRTDYSVAVLTEAGYKMDMLSSASANWERVTAANKMRAWLLEQDQGAEGERDKGIEVVFANNDDMALGAIDAYLQQCYTADTMPIVLGIDATPVGVAAVKSGLLYGTVVNDAVGQAAAIADLALALAEGRVPQPEQIEGLSGKVIRIPYRPLTLENYDEEMKKLREVH